MRRLALVTLVTMLALPGAALARPRAFAARVVRASGHTLTVRLSSGALVHYSSVRVAPPAAERPLLAHVARAISPVGGAFELEALEPGVTVLVTTTSTGATVSLPGPGSSEHQASGLVSDVQPDGFVVQLPDHTQLRLHASRGVRPRACETVSVVYHQDVALLVADRVHRAGSRSARRCAERSAAGTITAISSRALTLATAAGRSVRFAASGAESDEFVVGDVVDVSYVRGRAVGIEYVERIARGTVVSAGDGAVTVLESATGGRMSFAGGATTAAGAHVAIVYHRSGGRAVADVLYAQGG
jgi:hypothetical protein